MNDTSLIDIALIVAFASVGIAQVLALVRLVMGPTAGDRILAIDTMTINAIALVVLLGMAGGTHLYFEGALLFAMLGFVSTVAYARFVLRGDIIE